MVEMEPNSSVEPKSPVEKGTSKHVTHIILVAAGGAMGKSSLANVLKQDLEETFSQSVEVISEDWFYKPPTNEKAVKVAFPAPVGDESSNAFKLMHMDDKQVEEMAKDNGVTLEELKVVQDITKGLHSWSQPSALDMDQFCDVVTGIKAGETRTFREFSFSSKLQDGPEHTIEKVHYLIVEGVFALTGQDKGGPRIAYNGIADFKVTIHMEDYYNVGLQRVLTRDLERSKEGTLEERKAAIENQWKLVMKEYETYIEPYTKAKDVQFVSNGVNIDEFHGNIRKLAEDIYQATTSEALG